MIKSCAKTEKIEQILGGIKTSCNPVKVLKIIRWTDKIDPSKPFMLQDQSNE